MLLSMHLTCRYLGAVLGFPRESRKNLCFERFSPMKW